MSQRELTIIVGELTLAWFAVAGTGYLLFMRWRKRDLSRRR